MQLRFHAILVMVSLLLILGCSGGGKSPIVPSGENQQDPTTGDLRSIAASQTEPESYWSTPLTIEGKIWASHFNENGTLHRAIGPGIDAPDPLEFIGINPEIFQVKPENLSVLQDEIHSGIRYLIYNQLYKGIPVAKARVDFRYSKSGKLVMIGSDVFPQINITTTPSISDLSAYSILTSDINENPVPDLTDSELVVYPVPETGTLAWRIDAGNWRFYIDASNGQILERVHNQWDAFTQKVSNTTKMTSPLDPEIPVPGSYAMVGFKTGSGTFDGTMGYGYGDFSGYSEFTGTRTTAYAVCSFRSPWILVRGPNSKLAETRTDPSYKDYNWDSTNSKLSERMVFYWANASHDYLKNIDSTNTSLDFTCTGNVEGAAMCNANASSNSINFYQSADGCFNTGECPDVIIHEYAHVFTFHQYSVDVPTDVHEGCSDYFAATITDQSHIGNDIQGAGTMFRNCLNNVVWPAPECGGEGHCVGQILAGAFWDMRTALGRSYTDYLFVFSRYGQPITIPDFTPEILILDDDNDNVLDGTANYSTIYDSWYSNHGVAVPSAPTMPTTGVNVDLYPVKPPVRLNAASGGTVPFVLRLSNLDNVSHNFYIWATIDVPWFGMYGPIIPPAIQKKQPLYLSLQPLQTIQIQLNQWIPAGLPADTYKYHVRIGFYPSTLMDDAWFDITLN